MAATKVANSDKPQRYLYTGNVYRVEQTQGARQREFTQSGIELIGSYSPAADAEVISAAMEAVLAVGIEEFSREIGQIAFFNGLVKHKLDLTNNLSKSFVNVLIQKTLSVLRQLRTNLILTIIKIL